jgi:hypothetical protein
MKYWEIIADKLKKSQWSLGYVSAVDSKGQASSRMGVEPVPALRELMPSLVYV